MTETRDFKKGTPEYDKLMEEERLILDGTELIFELLEKKGLTKSDLARLLGKTRGYVSQVLSGSRNMTLRTLAEMACALDYRIKLGARPKAESKVKSQAIYANVHDLSDYRKARPQLRFTEGAPSAFPCQSRCSRKVTLGA